MKHIILAFVSMTVFQVHADSKVADIFKGVEVGKSACFTRQYTAEHMRSKPRQTVEQIKIKLYKQKYAKDQEAQNTLAIQVKRKNENKVWTNNIFCFDDKDRKTVLCAVECDGGSVEVLSRDESGKLVLKNNGVLLYGGCGDDTGKDGEELKTIYLKSRRGGDDIFNLNQSDVKACADVSDEAH